MYRVLVTAHKILIVAHGLSSSPEARGILVPPPGIKPSSPALEGRFLTTREVPKSALGTHSRDTVKERKYQFGRLGGILGKSAD